MGDIRKIRLENSFDPKRNLVSLINNLEIIQRGKNADRLILENSGFVTPLGIVPLCMPFLSFTTIGDVEILNQYSLNMGFPFGRRVSEIKSSNHKTYIPITRCQLDSLNKEAVREHLEGLSNSFVDVLHNQVLNAANFAQLVGIDTIAIIITELIDNVFEHAEAANVFVHAQYYRANDQFEICIVDDGICLFGSLNKANRHVSNDLDALKKVIEEHISAKEDTAMGIRHGTGIKNSRKLLCNNQVGGTFTLVSGSAAYIQEGVEQGAYYRLTNSRYNGTILGLRFKRPKARLEWRDYVKG